MITQEEAAALQAKIDAGEVVHIYSVQTEHTSRNGNCKLESLRIEELRATAFAGRDERSKVFLAREVRFVDIKNQRGYGPLAWYHSKHAGAVAEALEELANSEKEADEAIAEAQKTKEVCAKLRKQLTGENQ